MHRKTLGSIGLLLLAMACSSDSPIAPEPDQISPGLLPTLPAEAFAFGGHLVSAVGAGVADLSTTNPGFGDAHFVFLAWRLGNGPAFGYFRQTRTQPSSPPGGPDLLVEFEGRVTCLTIDPNFPGRARIGGVITKNNSTAPGALTVNHQVGADVWFRVQDGKAGAPDASTTYGFKPTLVNTSAEYCALPFTGTNAAGQLLWSLTSIFPLEKGLIDVRP